MRPKVFPVIKLVNLSDVLINIVFVLVLDVYSVKKLVPSLTLNEIVRGYGDLMSVEAGRKRRERPTLL